MSSRLLLLFLLATLPARADHPPAPVLTTRLTSTTWTVLNGDDPLLVYVFAPSQKKPYIPHLAPPGGSNILRDAPPDHLHHHGLMYGITVNSVNFWEESLAGGIQKPTAILGEGVVPDPDGNPQARIQQRILWLRPEAAARPDAESSALLIEDRTLIVGVAPAGATTVVRWISDFTVAAPEASLTGANYHGLGLRLRPDLDTVARPSFPDTGPVALAGTDQLVHPGAVGALIFDGPAAPLAVSLAAAPTNPGTSAFFTMSRPFAYLSATPSLDITPLRYSKGDRFQFDHTISVTRDPQSVHDLEITPPKA